MREFSTGVISAVVLLRSAGQVAMSTDVRFSNTQQSSLNTVAKAFVESGMRHSNHLVACPTAVPGKPPTPEIFGFAFPPLVFFMHQGGQAIYSVLKSLNSRDQSPGLYFNPAAPGKKEIHVY